MSSQDYVNSYLFTGYRGYTPFVSVNKYCAVLKQPVKRTNFANQYRLTVNLL